MKQIKHVSIIGAGTQGAMLAFRALAYGFAVSIFSRNAASREAAVTRMQDFLPPWLALHPTHRREDFWANLTVADSLEAALLNTDLIIENIPEYLEQKQGIWVEIDKLASKDAILTTNSSSYPSSLIGKDILRKPLTCNLNFMTPTKDNLVEVMWNGETSEETKVSVLQFLRCQDYIPIVTQKEIKGFSLNRVWRAMKKECLMLWSEGYITPEDFDRAFMLEWGTPHGPFGLMDKVGLDIVKQVEESYQAASGRADDAPPQALCDLVAQGLLGEKSGQGFYCYPNPAYEDEDFLSPK